MWHLVRRVIFNLMIGSILLISETNCLEWKYTVTSPKEIRFFDANWIYTNHRIMDVNLMNDVSVLAFDEKCNIMYFANNNFTNNQSQIYKSNKFDVENQLPTIYRVKALPTIIRGIAFDSLKRNLYWSNGISISQYNTSSRKTTTFLKATGTFPTDIAIDTCRGSRNLYYINQNNVNSSIESINLDTNVKKVIVTGLRTARSVTVDCVSNKLYWLDTLHSTNIRIGQANLNGTERGVLFNRTAENPIYLATDEDNIYYSSVTYKNVIQINKNNKLRTIIDYNFGRVTPIDILTKNHATEPNHQDCQKQKS